MEEIFDYTDDSQKKRRGLGPWKWILFILISIGVGWYFDSQDDISLWEDNMSFFDWFSGKKQPADVLLDYITALEKGERDNLLETIAVEEDSDKINEVLVEFAIHSVSVVSSFQDIYRQDLEEWANFHISPKHKAGDVKNAKFKLYEKYGFARMSDGQIYRLKIIDNKWKVVWPEFYLNGALVDSDMARAVIVPFSEAQAALGKDFITAELISEKLRDSLNESLAPFSDRMPHIYETYPLHDLSKIQAKDVSPTLRKDLELAYKNFHDAVIKKDPESFFEYSIIRSSEREIYDKKIESGEFDKFADWIAMMNPPINSTTFITVKTDGDDFAGYYFAWVPSYSKQYHNLSVRQFEKTSKGWKMLYSMNGAYDIPLSVDEDEDLNARIFEIIETNPILKLKRPVRKNATKQYEEFDVALKEELASIYNAYLNSLINRDVDSFFKNVRTSVSEERHIAKNYKNIFPDILDFWPPLNETTFVTVSKLGDEFSGYYFVASHPDAQEFENVVLMPFIRHGGRWKVLFSLDAVTYMNLLIAKTDGDKISKAFELIDQEGSILDLKSLVYQYEEGLIPDDQRNLILAQEAIINEQYETSVQLLEPLIQEGMVKAKTAMGLLYSEGNGVNQDLHKSFEFFSESAEQGDIDALYYLGYAYHKGEGVEADQILALAYLIAAEELGNERAEREIEKAMAALEEDAKIEAKKRASSIVSEIIKQQGQ